MGSKVFSEIEFKGEGKVKDIQIVRTGIFTDPRYGKFEITPKMLREMKKNFDDNVRGIKIAMDYGHKSDEEAAGWFKEVYLAENDSELWAKVEMTNTGDKKLTEKEYGYISPEFDNNYETNEVPVKTVGCTLLGAALTNRPVIKMMKPATQLSEGDKTMTEKELQDKVTELEKKLADKQEQEDKMLSDLDVASIEEVMEMIQKLKSGAVENSEDEEEAKKELSETKGTVKKLQAANKDLEKKLAEAKKEQEFTILLSEGKACAAQKDAYMKGDMAEFARKASEMNLSEKGHGKGGNSGADAESKVMSLAQEKVKANGKLDLGTAISMVLKENPELNKQYQGEA